MTKMIRRMAVRQLVVVLVFLMGLVTVAVVQAQNQAAAAVTKVPVDSWKYIGASLAVGLACLGGGIAVGRIGAAAMGAMAENPDLAGKAMPFVGLAEGICLWGFLVAVLILFL